MQTLKIGAGLRSSLICASWVGDTVVEQVPDDLSPSKSLGLIGRPGTMSFFDGRFVFVFSATFNTESLTMCNVSTTTSLITEFWRAVVVSFYEKNTSDRYVGLSQTKKVLWTGSKLKNQSFRIKIRLVQVSTTVSTFIEQSFNSVLTHCKT